MGAGLLYNIALLDTDKKSCNCVRFDKLTYTTETYIKPSTTRRGGTPDKVCTICCLFLFFQNTKQKNVSYLYFLLKSRILFGEKTFRKK